MKRLDHRHDLVAGPRVEVARRLIGQEQDRIVDERARDGDPLLLASRELGRAVPGPALQPHHLELALRPFPALATRDVPVEQRHLDVGLGGDPRQQIELLEDEADAAVADLRQVVVAQARHVAAFQQVAARRRRVEAAEDRHERGLARTRTDP